MMPSKQQRRRDLQPTVQPSDEGGSREDESPSLGTTCLLLLGVFLWVLCGLLCVLFFSFVQYVSSCLFAPSGALFRTCSNLVYIPYPFSFIVGLEEVTSSPANHYIIPCHCCWFRPNPWHLIFWSIRRTWRDISPTDEGPGEVWGVKNSCPR